jgi:AmmeMemoRadiSam system protein B/AmmeMemoRadiSam system protein A
MLPNGVVNMKCNESSGPKSPVVVIVALCVLSALLVCCTKSPDSSKAKPEKSEAKEEEPQAIERKLEAKEQEKVVLTSSLAGRWYSADPEALRGEIRSFSQKADVRPKDNVIALILPHAGYRFSGQTAAFGVKTAAKRYKRVIVIGPSHYVNMPGVLSVPAATHYSTPLGLVPLDTQFIEKLKTNPMFRNISQAHQYEHSVQIEVPLLQYAQPDFELVPIVAGQCSLEHINSAAATLKTLVDSNTLVVASSDFVHYGSNFGYTPFRENIPDQIKKIDMGAYEHIAGLDSKGFLEYKQRTGATICGYIPVAILLAMCEKPIKAELLKYATSGELTGDFTNSVSYLSVAFYGKWQEKSKMNEEIQTEKLSKADKEQLLKLARGTLEFYLKEGKVPEPAELGVQVSSAMKRRAAAFVTLKKHSMLRGCIGDILPRGPLYESVIRNVVNAGVNDWRFPPVTSGECEQLVFEVSALTVPKPVASTDEIRIGIDGVILRKQDRSAVFLPQVAPEQGWDVDQMLSHLSTKANLPADAWKQDAEFFVFQADVFGENE